MPEIPDSQFLFDLIRHLRLILLTETRELAALVAKRPNKVRSESRGPR
jgi:hypothetical protein